MHLLYAAGRKDGWVTENSEDDNDLISKATSGEKLFFKNECALSGPWTDMCLNSQSFTQARQTTLAKKKYLDNASMEDISF